MFNTFYKCLLFLSFIYFAASCSKDSGKPLYVVSAANIIAMTGSDWNNFEPELSNKKDYLFTTFPEPSGDVASVVTIPALDDSNRNVQGTLVLNVTVDGKVRSAVFQANPLTQEEAYAMMINYNRETVETVPEISFSIGDMADSVFMGNVPVDVIVEKLQNGVEADKLAISYSSLRGSFSMVVSKVDDGSYAFGFNGFG